MSALSTDLYQLTMAAGYFHQGLEATEACCEMFVRRLPRPRRYLLAAGIEQVVAYIHDLAFSADDIAFLSDLPALRDAMTPPFVDYLKRFRFSGSVNAVREGTVMFAGEPFLQVTAPIIEAQIVETFVLSTLNHATMMASKAARIVQAAAGRNLLEFGTRRTHPGAAVDAARAAYLAGFQATSNVEAGRRFGIPVRGTAAHMWTMTHDSEQQAFDNYVATFPNAAILLIDTYDTVRGAERAAASAKEQLKGVRLDSGDLDALSRQVRAVLDRHGLHKAQILASGDLNEYKIAQMVADGTPIDAFGVGTELVCSKDAPSLGGVYKVVQFVRDGRTVPIAKFSEGKATYPGPHALYRRRGDDGAPKEDVLALAGEGGFESIEALLEERIRAGALVRKPRELADSRAHAAGELATLSAWHKDLEPTQERQPVRLSPGLERLTADVKRSKA